MIRQYNEDDIDAVMQIWLDTNIRAHNFISSGYWRINFDMVREMLSQQKTGCTIRYSSCDCRRD